MFKEEPIKEQRQKKEKDPYEGFYEMAHHVSKRHPAMPQSDRAAQFLPFAALTGFGAVIKETARLTDEKPELDENEKFFLDTELARILSEEKSHPRIALRFFLPDALKEGGSIESFEGTLKRFEEAGRRFFFEDGTVILLDDVLELKML